MSVDNDVGTQVRRPWARVAVIAFGTFAVGTLEFVLAGVLSEFSATFGISISTAGQTVTVFAATCAIATPVLATSTAMWNRRKTLLLAVAIHLVGVVVTALAPSFALVLVGMAIAAGGAGLFIPTGAVTASALVGEQARGRAIALVTIGLTSATALGAPIGTVVGSLFGWRATIWFVAVIATAAGVAILLAVPSVPGSAGGGMRERLAPLADRRVVTTLATTLAAFTAVYIVYTYISAVFGPATGGEGVRLAILMFAWGLVGTAGNFAAGSLADRVGARKVVSSAVALLAVVFVVLPWTTAVFWAALVLTVVYGIAAWAVTAPQQHRLIGLNPEAATVLVSLTPAFLYLAIALSGVIGAVGISVVGSNSLSYIAAVVAVVALVLSEVAHRVTARRARGEGPSVPAPEEPASTSSR